MLLVGNRLVSFWSYSTTSRTDFFVSLSILDLSLVNGGFEYSFDFYLFLVSSFGFYFPTFFFITFSSLTS